VRAVEAPVRRQAVCAHAAGASSRRHVGVAAGSAQASLPRQRFAKEDHEGKWAQNPGGTRSVYRRESVVKARRWSLQVAGAGLRQCGSEMAGQNGQQGKKERRGVWCGPVLRHMACGSVCQVWAGTGYVWHRMCEGRCSSGMCEVEWAWQCEDRWERGVQS